MLVNRLKSTTLRKLGDGKHLDGNGLYLVVNGNSRRWVLRFRFKLQRHELGLGSLRDVTLQQAREKAEEAHRQIRNGEHPLLKRRAEEKKRVAVAVAASAHSKKLGDFVADALQWHYELRALRSKDWVKQNIQVFKKYIESTMIGLLPIAEITKQHIADLIRPKWGTPTGTRMLIILRVCFSYATLKGFYTDNAPTVWENGLSLLLPQKSKVEVVKHHAACPWKKIPEVFAKLHDMRDCASKRVLMACILCAPRLGEMLALRTSDIDFEKRILTIQRSKTSTEPWEIPYPVQMDEVFSPRGEFPFDTYVAKSTLRDYFYSAFNKEFTIHGFRSTFSTWCADHEKNVETREACLHHSLGNAVTLSYQRSSLLENRRRLLQEWADYVTSDIRTQPCEQTRD